MNESSSDSTSYVHRFKLKLFFTVSTLLCCSFAILEHASAEAIPAGKGSYEDLIILLDEFLEFRDPGGEKPYQIIRDRAGLAIDPVTDYSERAIAAQGQKIAEFQDRIQDMDVASWNRGQQVDYLAVRSRLNQAEFLLHLNRPWARDPGFYVDRMLRVTFTDLPVEGAERETFLAKLRAITVLVLSLIHI